MLLNDPRCLTIKPNINLHAHHDQVQYNNTIMLHQVHTTHVNTHTYCIHIHTKACAHLYMYTFTRTMHTQSIPSLPKVTDSNPINPLSCIKITFSKLIVKCIRSVKRWRVCMVYAAKLSHLANGTFCITYNLAHTLT